MTNNKQSIYQRKDFLDGLRQPRQKAQ